jgi:hypothetical protein
MSTQNAGGGSGHSGHAGEPSTSVGVGPENDHKRSPDGSQEASGGSGGPQMTHDIHDTHSDAPVPHDEASEVDAGCEPEAAGSAATTATRGPQDTHSHQAGATETGLGVPETGGNQSSEDLAPPAR